MPSTDRHGDDGFSLVETVVAMAIFAVLAAVTGAVLLSALSMTSSSSRRTAAANIAARYVEEVRGMRALDIPDGGAALPDATVGGTTYKVKRTASYVASGESVSLCAGSGTAAAYKLVTIVVTWPDMGATQPVRADTLKALGLGVDGLTSTRGIAALQVLNAANQPVPRRLRDALLRRHRPGHPADGGGRVRAVHPARPGLRLHRGGPARRSAGTACAGPPARPPPSP